jgi:hypothetical protein
MCLTGKFHDKNNYEEAYLSIAVTMLHNTVTDLVLFIFHINDNYFKIWFQSLKNFII